MSNKGEPKGSKHDLELGKLCEVCVRDVWKHEAGDFTPWLSKNLDRLMDVLGISLELEETEMKVGALKADIVARIPAGGARVLIENQLEKTDLKHLGQILAYLAGLEAQFVIWIATRFREDHLSAIRWLNQHTADPFGFFAVKVRAFKIEMSPYAPTFEILEKPAEWERILGNIRQEMEERLILRDFWAHCVARWPNSLGLKKGHSGRRFRRWIMEADLRVTLYMRMDKVRVYVTGNGDEDDEVVFERIDKYRSELLKALEDSSILPDPNYRCTTELKINVRDRNNWDEIANWLDWQRGKYEEILRCRPDTGN